MNDKTKMNIDDFEPAAHMFRCDLDDFKVTETCADAFSVEMGHPDKGETEPLYTKEQMLKFYNSACVAVVEGE